MELIIVGYNNVSHTCMNSYYKNASKAEAINDFKKYYSQLTIINIIEL